MIGDRSLQERRWGLLCLFAVVIFCGIFLLALPVEDAYALIQADGRFRTTPPIPQAFSTPTPTPLASALPIPITTAGCCANPFWSPDSDWVLFLDQRGSAHAGLYAVPSDGGEALLVNDRVGTYSPDLTMIAYLENGQTFVERWVDRARWIIPSQGREVFFSPSGENLCWSMISSGVTFPNLRQRAIWVAAYDGSDAREIVTVTGGEFLGWTAGEDAILVSGRLAPDLPAGIWRIELDSGAGLLLYEIEVPLRALVSPGGEQIAFIQAFEESGRNGLWMVGADGSSAQRLEVFGAFRWLDDDHLAVIPMDLEADSPSLWRVTAGGEPERWVDLGSSGQRIVNNDWLISPDASRLVFRSARDDSLWVITLPEP
ncbi:MAG: hypothetical protein JXA97_14040 [Anaerolineales bacterium]|nr:hypothetical protein [Anaerolineales bacterium]